MSVDAGVLFLVAAACALADWFFVARGLRVGEIVFKLATSLALLTCVVVTPEAEQHRSWFVGALAMCVAGDVFLLNEDRLFTAGLASFLGAHVLFIGGWISRGVDGTAILVAALVLVSATLPVARRIVRGLAGSPDDRRLRLPVLAYMGALLTMAATAAGTGIVAAAGGTLFVVSDSLLAWDRFVRRFRQAHLAVMITYHLALGLLVISILK